MCEIRNGRRGDDSFILLCLFCSNLKHLRCRMWSIRASITTADMFIQTLAAEAYEWALTSRFSIYIILECARYRYCQLFHIFQLSQRINRINYPEIKMHTLSLLINPHGKIQFEHFHLINLACTKIHRIIRNFYTYIFLFSSIFMRYI